MDVQMHPNHMRLVAVEPQRVKQLLDSGQGVLVDVREEDEWLRERIAGAIHMPLSRFDPSGLPESRGKTLIIHCLAGARSSKAAGILFHSGRLDVMHMLGGLTGWKMAGFDTVRSSDIRLPA